MASSQNHDPLTAPLQALLVFAVASFALSFLSRNSFSVSGLPQLYFLLASLFIMFRQEIGVAQLGLQSSRWLREIGIGLLVTLAPLLVIVLVYYFFSSEVLRTADAHVEFRFKDYYQLFILVIVAPISEELFFRGILASALRRHLSSAFTILAVSILFMAAHFGWHIGAFLLGLATTAMYLWRRSIIASVVLHMCCNAFGPLLVLFLPDVYATLRVFFL